MPPPALMHFYCLHPLFLHTSLFLPHTTTTSLSPSATFCFSIGVAIPHLPHAPLFYPFLLLTRSFSFFASFFSDRAPVTFIFLLLSQLFHLHLKLLHCWRKQTYKCVSLKSFDVNTGFVLCTTERRRQTKMSNGCRRQLT